MRGSGYQHVRWPAARGRPTRKRTQLASSLRPFSLDDLDKVTTGMDLFLRPTVIAGDKLENDFGVIHEVASQIPQ
ncbi:hypothetical protein SAMN05444164_3837 [Bradyrhizobium erythrophlei]|uniref:Uncharacterized protein n=1 Tax=Bradyrhizobium erythrophlei TaxID=1437360 RepID=A0A1H4Y913_9BRAD|nr:hypothetical protein SAMN05444164_3837 [Bradyrhizobium erythrophlei]